jgi:hypothetical protein
VGNERQSQNGIGDTQKKYGHADREPLWVKPVCHDGMALVATSWCMPAAFEVAVP